jgi:hypothetical protein
LLLGAVECGAAGNPADLLLFWFESPSADRVRVASVSPESLAAVLRRIDQPADPGEQVIQNDPGVRVADTALPEAPPWSSRSSPEVQPPR